jgi:hypothetical protein
MAVIRPQTQGNMVSMAWSPDHQQIVYRVCRSPSAVVQLPLSLLWAPDAPGGLVVASVNGSADAIQISPTLAGVMCGGMRVAIGRSIENHSTALPLRPQYKGIKRRRGSGRIHAAWSYSFAACDQPSLSPIVSASPRLELPSRKVMSSTSP